MGEELKPCPFCGGEAELIDVPLEDEENGGGSCIQCSRCVASTALHFDRKENLVSSWNTRAKEAYASALESQCSAEKMREALEGIDKYLLVITSAVRRADPQNYDGVMAALDAVRAALSESAQ